MKNFVPILIVIVLIAVGGWWYMNKANVKVTPTKTTQQTTVEEESTTNESTSTDKSFEIQNFAFSPKTLTVKTGEQFTVTNKDVAGHSFTADDGKSFDTGVISKGQSRVVTAPTVPGSYPFHCTPHPSMTGTLIVE